MESLRRPIHPPQAAWGYAQTCGLADTTCWGLLYWTWRGGEDASEASSLDALPYVAEIFRLGTDLSGFKDTKREVFMNLTEQFFSLIFQSLQPKDLAAWLPDGTKINAGHGLSIALPVNQYHIGKERAYAHGRTTELLNSEDPVNRAYPLSTLMARVAQIQRDHRDSASYSEIFWDGEPFDTSSVRTQCRTCRTERMDEQPRYLRLTGQYVARRPNAQCARSQTTRAPILAVRPLRRCLTPLALRSMSGNPTRSSANA